MSDVTLPPMTGEELEEFLKKGAVAGEKAKLEREALQHLYNIQSKTLANPNLQQEAADAAYKNMIDTRKLEAERFAKIRNKMRMPSSVQIDPSLLKDQAVKDIDLAAYKASKAPLAKLGKYLMTGAKVAAPVVGAAVDIAATPEVGEGSDIVPGRPSFENLYGPKIKALRSLAGKK